MPLAQRIGGVLVRPDSLVFSAENGAVITFDRAGRLYSAYLDDRFYRRGVDGRVVEKYTAEGTIRRRLDPSSARAIEERALRLALGVPGAQAHMLILDLDLDAAAFRAAYDGPIPILPPDTYRALVLQATVGCAYNACLFCSFYRDRPFRVRGLTEFAQHVRQVERVFGKGMSMRRGVFLGDADALVADTDRLLEMIRSASAVPPAKNGFSCFGAIFGEHDRSAAEWADLKDAGLRHVYLGIETGHDPLRRRLKKPGTTGDALRLVRSLKRAGIGVGLIFLLGPGGRVYEAEHVRDSAALCRAAPLDRGDFVYLSPLVGPSGMRNRDRVEAQAGRMREAIGEGPRVAIYDIRNFVY